VVRLPREVCQPLESELSPQLCGTECAGGIASKLPPREVAGDGRFGQTSGRTDSLYRATHAEAASAAAGGGTPLALLTSLMVVQGSRQASLVLRGCLKLNLAIALVLTLALALTSNGILEPV